MSIAPIQDSQPPKKSIFKKLGISHPILEYKTPFDQSHYSCAENILRGTARSFILTYGAKAGISFLMTLLKFKQVLKNPRLLLGALFNKDNFKLGCFTGSLTGIMKIIILLTRILRKADDGWNGCISSFLAAYLSFFFFQKNNRAFMACFMLSRAFDCFYNHLVNSGKIKKSKYHYALIFATLNMLTGYAYAHEPYLNSPSMNNFGDKMTSQSDNDLTVMMLWREATRRRLVKAGVIHDPYLKDE